MSRLLDGEPVLFYKGDSVWLRAEKSVYKLYVIGAKAQMRRRQAPLFPFRDPV